MKKVWIETLESNVDGEIYFFVVVCKDKETAISQMMNDIELIKKESAHFKNFDTNDEYFTIEKSDHRFFIMDDSDDYYEEIKIEEKEIV